MPIETRNKFESDKFVLARLESKEDFDSISSFDCGNPDLNDFFRDDAFMHRQHLLAETYYFQPIKATREDIFIPVAFISFLNDNIPLTKEEGKTNKKDFKKQISKVIPYKFRRYNTFPAVKIGRLGVNKDYHRHNLGTYLLNMTKEFFLTHNRTGCRFITVDAYRDDATINFYKKNGFQFLIKEDGDRETRIMYFDLKRFKDQSKPIIK